MQADELMRVWQAYSNVAHPFFTAGPAGETLVGPGWFAALSHEQSGELNVCGLTPEATVTSAQVLVLSIATDLPLIIFVSEQADPGGRSIPRGERFRDGHGHGAADAHDAADSGAAQMWLAWDGAEPISVVWIGRHEECIGVMEMMTPERCQRRGAGRPLLTHALAAEWRDDTEFAVLIATPAGRRLYESIGFEASDETLNRFRGLEDGALAGTPLPRAWFVRLEATPRS